ncbi:hypothetical protein R6Q57_001511 [Mikania cordata]
MIFEAVDGGGLLMLIVTKVNLQAVAYVSKSKSLRKDNDALQLLRLIWENIAKKAKKDIDDIIRGPPDTAKKDERLPYNKKDQKLHLLKIISENIVKMPAEIHKLTTGSSAKVPSMGNARKTYPSRMLFVAAEMGNTIFVSFALISYSSDRYNLS